MVTLIIDLFLVVVIIILWLALIQKDKQIKNIERENKLLEQRFNRYIKMMDRQMDKLRKQVFREMDIHLEPHKSY